MKLYALYDTTTGVIIQTGNCPDEMLPLQVFPGKGMIEGEVDQLGQYVDLATLTLAAYTPEEMAAKTGLAHGWLWKMPERIAVDMRQLATVQAQAIENTFSDVNRVVEDAIGNLFKEYVDAEADARAFAAAGYAGVAPESVSSYAKDNSTKLAQTDEWAAQNIIARANAFEWAQGQMRTNRFKHQGLMRTAATLADVDTAVTSWNTFIAQLRAQLGL